MPRTVPISVLKKRSEFLSVASHRKKWVTPAFVLQVAPRLVRLVKTDEAATPDLSCCGVGLTASKKTIGNAVRRNRARRRLRALAQEVIGSHAQTGLNFVLIARQDILTLSYDALRADMEKALKRLKLWRDGVEDAP